VRPRKAALEQKAMNYLKKAEIKRKSGWPKVLPCIGSDRWTKPSLGIGHNGCAGRSRAVRQYLPSTFEAIAQGAIRIAAFGCGGTLDWYATECRLKAPCAKLQARIIPPRGARLKEAVFCERESGSWKRTCKRICAVAKWTKLKKDQKVTLAENAIPRAPWSRRLAARAVVNPRMPTPTAGYMQLEGQQTQPREWPCGMAIAAALGTV